MATAAAPIPIATGRPAKAGLMTAEEFAIKHGDGGAELIDGVVVEEPVMPNARHGQVCSQVIYQLSRFVETHDLGHVLSNDTFLLVARDPDRVRGVDVMYYSFDRLPRGPVPTETMTTPPNLAIEVKSPSNRYWELLQKATEYLTIGVTLVWVVDPELRMVAVFTDDDFPVRLDNGSTLTAPGVLPGFELPLAKLFG